MKKRRRTQCSHLAVDASKRNQRVGKTLEDPFLLGFLQNYPHRDSNLLFLFEYPLSWKH